MSCDVFERAVQLAAADRPAFIEAACRDTPHVLRLVTRMLEADGSRSNAFDRMSTALGPTRARDPDGRTWTG